MRRVASVVVLLGVLAGACAPGDDDDDVAGPDPSGGATTGTTASEPSTGDASAPSPDGAWERRAGPGTTGTAFPATVTGGPDVAYAWGSSDGGVGGWTFDPDDGTWSALPEAPVEPLSGGVAAWTGDELLVWGLVASSLGPGTTRAAGATYDPGAGTWTPLPDHGVGYGLGWWTGTELLVLHEGAGGVVVSTWDPTTRAWTGPEPTPLADVPADRLASWSGEELLVHDERAGADRGWDPATGRWRELPSSPHADRVFSWYLWLGDEWWQLGGGTLEGDAVVDLGGAVAYAPAGDAWRTVDDPPALSGPALELPGGAWWVDGAGDPPTAFLHDPSSDATEAFPGVPLTYRVVVVGGRLVAIGLGPGPGGVPTLDALVYVPGSDAGAPDPVEPGAFTTTTLGS